MKMRAILAVLMTLLAFVWLAAFGAFEHAPLVPFVAGIVLYLVGLMAMGKEQRKGDPQ